MHTRLQKSLSELVRLNQSRTLKLRLSKYLISNHHHGVVQNPEAEFKEFERRFEFKPRFEYDWFHLKFYQMFQGLSRRLI